MAENVVLKLDNVSKSFAKVEKDEITHALGNINLEMRSGEFISSGRNLRLRQIHHPSLDCRTDYPYHGSIDCQRPEITGPDPERGMVFQRPTLFPWLTVEKTLPSA